ncbi:Philalide A [Teratosphaeria destructans]|uniref:Philalide A n=1 Tax=Teratosphaeria destructans TaxID=418781 RepID=A0A9W7SQA5_9PEZI|nr:Philalide A [Teratosphaeria destructans]
MRSNILTFAAVSSTLASAIPMEPAKVHWEAPGFGDAFGIAATGKGIINASLRAVGGALYVGGEQPGVTCEADEHPDFATFGWYIDKSLFLYGSSPVQQVKVDNSEVGQGTTFYVTGNQDKDYPGADGPFEIDSVTRVVKFGKIGAKACPTGEIVDQAEIKERHRIYFTEYEEPGQNKGCVDVELLAYKTDGKPRCEYTSS